MYEKYTGLPDVSLNEPQNTGVKRSVSGRAQSGARTGAASRGVTTENIYPTRSGAAERGGYSAYASGSSGAGSRASSGSGGGRSGSGAPRRMSAARRKKLERRRIAVSVSAITLLALLAVAIAVIVKSCNKPVAEIVDPANDVFRAQVSINGIDVSGKTVEEARALIEPGIEYTVQNIAITLKNDTVNQMITGSQMLAVSDIDAVLTTALSGGAGQAYYTKFTFDYDALGSCLDDINQSLAEGPTEPTMQIVISNEGKPSFEYSEGKRGYGIDVAATEELVKQALEKNELQAVLEPMMTYQEPTTTVEQLKASMTLRGEFSTSYRIKAATGTAEEKQIVENRAFNVAKGAELINNEVVKPGKSWSFNSTVGNRTEKNGWKQANGISFGDRFTLQYGGGICQVSTTLYGALLRAGIPYSNISRQEHSIPSDYVEYGQDATVDSGHIDFKFKNTTDSNLYIFAYITSSKTGSRWRDIVVRIYGEALPEGVTYKPRTVLKETIPPGEPIITYDRKQPVEYSEVTVTARDGYVVDVYLDTYVNGKKDGDGTFLYTDKYEAITEKRKVGTITPTPVPTPTPPPTAPPPADTPVV